MRRRAPGPLRSGAIVGVALLALAAAAADAVARPPGSAGAAKRGAKPKPVTCRATQVTIVLKGRTRCRPARPGSAANATPLAVARAMLSANTPTLRAKGGRRIRPIWKSAPGLGRIRTRLLRALPKVLGLVERRARASARVPGDPPACASDPRGPQQTSSDGFTVGIAANGDVTMSVSASSGYRLEAFLGGLQDCADLDLPECPTPDGHLDGTDGRRSELGVKVTKDGALVQSLRTTLRSRQTLRGTVADDAKLDDLDLADAASETLTFQIPGRTVSVHVSLRGSARLSFRSGAITGARVQTDVGFSGTTAADALGAAGHTIDEYVQRFPDLVRREGAHLTRREQLWQTPGRCAKLTFDPATDATKLREGQEGGLGAKVEAKAGGVAAKAKWTVSEVRNGVVTPAAAEGGSTSFHWLVTRAGRDVRLAAKLRATSTAGVAEETWSEPTQADAQLAFAIDAVHYDASNSGSITGPGLPCDTSGSTHESALAGPLPFDPATAAFEPLGEGFAGSIVATPPALSATRTGMSHGCDLSQPPPPPACQTPVNLQVPVALGVVVQIPGGGGAAKLTWVLPGVEVGDGGPAVPCYTPTITAVPPAEERQEPERTFLDPGQHTVSVARNLSVTAPLGPATQTVTGNASASITFHRVNADGSPYTG